MDLQQVSKEQAQTVAILIDVFNAFTGWKDAKAEIVFLKEGDIQLRLLNGQNWFNWRIDLNGMMLFFFKEKLIHKIGS